MSKFKVVCNQADYAYTFNTKSDAEAAAERHRSRTNHSPIFIYELDDNNEMTRDELLAFTNLDINVGILNIESV